jgi:hypothetical protein
LKPIISNFGNDVKGKTGTLVSPQTGASFAERMAWKKRKKRAA